MSEKYYYIGEAAGKIYKALKKSGENTASKLQKEIKVSDSALFNQALGWLAREKKVEIAQKGRSYKITLCS